MYKINPEKVKKLFTVSVTRKPYPDWLRERYRDKPETLKLFMKDAAGKTAITTTVKISYKCPYRVAENVGRRLTARGFDIRHMTRLFLYHLTYYVKTDILEFKGDTPQEIDQKAKEYCKKIKEQTVKELIPIFVDELEDFDWQLWPRETEQLMIMGVISKRR